MGHRGQAACCYAGDRAQGWGEETNLSQPWGQPGEDLGYLTRWLVRTLWFMAHTTSAFSLWLPVLVPGHLPIHREREMGSLNCNQAGNSLSSCRGCNGKGKNLLVSIGLISDGCISFLRHKKTLHPKKSLSVESCCVSGSPGHTAASYLSCPLCETWGWWEATSEQSTVPYNREARHKLVGICSAFAPRRADESVR